MPLPQRNKAGRSTLPEELQKVKLTITLSPEAFAIVISQIAVKGTAYYNNRSRYIESKILSETP